MNICDTSKTETDFVVGNLYKVKSPSLYTKDRIYIYTKSGKVVDLSTGDDSGLVSDRSQWVDVTDQYCLQKVK